MSERTTHEPHGSTTKRTRGLFTLFGVMCGLLALVAIGMTAALTTPTAQNAATIDASTSGGAAVGADANDGSFVQTTIPVPADSTSEQAAAIKASYALTSVSAAQAARLTSSAGLGAVVLSTAGDTVTVAVPQAQQATASSLVPGASFEANEPVSIDTTQSNPPSWGLDRIDSSSNTLDNSYSYDTSGTGVRIYMIDTGIYASNSDFSGRIATGYSTVSDGLGTNDCNGHGTHTAGTAAGTVYGVAKTATLVPVRVLGCSGSGYMSDIITAINWIMSTHPGGPAVISMSIGGPSSSTVNAAVSAAVARGFVVVQAAGNSSANACNYSPSGAVAGITVAASNRDGSFASYSNSGSCVDLEAPGTNIVSDYLGGTATLSGTSMATPHVSGEAARILQAHPTWNTAQVLSYLQSVSPTGTVTSVPAGTVNRLAVLPYTAPAPSSTSSATPTPTRSTTASPSPSVTPSATASPTPSASATPSATATPRATSTPTTGPSPSQGQQVTSISGLVATRVSTSSEQLSWTVSGSFTQFTVSVTDTASGRTASALFTGTTRTVTVLGLTAGHSYSVTVLGSYAGGSTSRSLSFRAG